MNLISTLSIFKKSILCSVLFFSYAASLAQAASVRDTSDITISKVTLSQRGPGLQAVGPKFLVMARSTSPKEFESFIHYFVATGAQKEVKGNGHVYTHPLAQLEWAQDRVNPANGFSYTLQFQLSFDELVSVAAANGLADDPLFVEFTGDFAKALFNAMLSSNPQRESGPKGDSDLNSEESELRFFAGNLKCEKPVRNPVAVCTLRL